MKSGFTPSPVSPHIARVIRRPTLNEATLGTTSWLPDKSSLRLQPGAEAMIEEAKDEIKVDIEAYPSLDLLLIQGTLWAQEI